MLENILTKLRSIFVITLVVLLVGAFALTFGGPQTEGCAPPSEGNALVINGAAYPERDVQATLRFMGDLLRDARLLQIFDARGAAIEGIIERRLLADEARELGFEISIEDALVESMRSDQVMLTLGGDAPLPSGKIPFRFHDEEGRFNRENAEGYLRNALGLSPGAFGKWQAEELLAEQMRELIRGRVVVSEQELLDAYRAESDTVSIRYVHYRADHFRELAGGESEPNAAWKADNELAIEAEYQKNLHRYKNLPPEVRARHILLLASSDDQKLVARAKLELLRAQLEGGADFAAVAEANSEDPETAKLGGDLGFRARGRMPAAFDEAAFSLEPGALSAIVETPFGLHLIKVEEKREGDVPVEEAKREIAARLFAEARGRGAARKAAERALEALVSGESNMDALTEQLAEVDAPFAPGVVTSLTLSRGSKAIPELSDSAALTAQALGLGEGDLSPAPYASGDDFVIYQIEARTRPAPEGPDAETRARLRVDLLERKQEETLRQHVAERREAARESGSLRIEAAPERG